MIQPDTSLNDVAFIVCTRLAQVGVTAVLSGGSAASIWSGGKFQSYDCDFIIVFYKAGAPGTAALKDLGYSEKNGAYVHPANPFALEFPAGPLSIGDDLISHWEKLEMGDQFLYVLTATDSCRDRLAAYYYWNDQSSLQAALDVARTSAIELSVVEEWSKREGQSEKFLRFKEILLTNRP